MGQSDEETWLLCPYKFQCIILQPCVKPIEQPAQFTMPNKLLNSLYEYNQQISPNYAAQAGMSNALAAHLQLHTCSDQPRQAAAIKKAHQCL